jgi:hypothetical protein
MRGSLCALPAKYQADATTVPALISFPKENETQKNQDDNKFALENIKMLSKVYFVQWIQAE